MFLRRKSARKLRGNLAARQITTAITELLEQRCLLAAEPVITEFMAQNNSTIKDEDGDFSDWIEIYNPNPAPLNLNGYFLADKPTKLNKWKFPNVSLAGRGYMIVWASNKNRVDPTKPLHTNFALSADGDYLALVKPDGKTVDQDFGTQFPAQNPDVSYGIPLTNSTLVGSTANATYFIPQNGNLGTDWTASNFDDSTWTTGENGIGFDTTGVLTSAIHTDVKSVMQNKGTSAYERLTFNVTDPTQLDALTLSMRYNDGFVAYLNGTQIARKNAPSSTQWNSTANATGPNGAPAQSFDVSSFLSLLQPGTNVLAVDGLNEAKGDADFFMSPQLIGLNARVGTPTFLTPTPGAINNANSILFVSDTKFDHDRGIYTSPFDLVISTDTPGANIRYTTDGSAPTTTSGKVYSGPVHITTTTVIRAIAYQTGMTPTDVDAETYIFPNDVIHQPANIAGYPNPDEPVTNLGPNEIDVPLDYQMDPNIVNNNAYKTDVINGLESIPTLSIGVSSNLIFGPNGFYETGINDDGVEAPISFEYIDPNHPDDTIQVNAGISGHSKPRLKRAFNIHFRSSYGASKLDDGMFQDAPLGGSTATNEIDQLILRAGNNRSWATTSSPGLTTYTEDEWVRQNQIAVSGVGTHGTFVQLYINGIYWGLYNMVERPDAGYGAAYYGGDKDNWFAVSQDGVQDGDDTRWNFMLNTLATENMANASNYAQMQQYLNVQEFADYLISEWYAGKSDWPTNNYWAGGDTVKKQPFQFFSWDGEYMFNTVFLPKNAPAPPNGAWVNPYFIDGDSDGASAPAVKLWRALEKSPEFMTMFADRAYKALENNGALTDANALARWNTLNNFISDAVVDESARWGDSLETTGRPTRTRDGDWTSAVNTISNIIDGNADRLIKAMRDAGFYPDIDPATMSQQGGLVASGFKLVLTNPSSSGTIYYTTDGSDPRVAGGMPNPNAKQYTGTKITLTANTTISVRVLKNGEWSALNHASFAINTIANLRVTELMYHPKLPDNAQFLEENYEFIELKNTGNASLNLNGVQITGGISFTFGNINLAAGDHILVVNSKTAFESLYGTGLNIAGEYSGKLSNAGDEIKLSAPGNITLADFNYSDLWYTSTDGDGFSLVVVDPTDDPAGLSDASAWQPSGELNGTPGTDESSIAANAVVINEVLSNASGASGDEIELKNTTNQSIDISGWYLSDSNSNLKKFKIPAGTSIPGGGFVTFTQADDFGSAFTLSSTGESVFLSSADSNGVLNGYQASVKFGPADKNVPFARFVNSAGDVKFVAESAATFGAENAAPLVGPVVINEIHYHPVSGAEFLELKNTSNSAVDLTGWTFTNGITFTFGAVSLQPGAFAVLTDSDPTTFAATYHVPAGVPVFQYTGSLDNSGETVSLADSDLVLVDSVSFDDATPWPTSPDGTGPTLAKKTANVFGDDPIAWQASALTNGTPGRDNATVNTKPVVSAGDDQEITFPTTANLSGTATDDGLPAGLPLTTAWSKVSGPGTVKFGDATQLATTATFSTNGTYVLRLTANDGALSNTNDVTIMVDPSPLPVITIAATDATASEPGSDTGTYTITRAGNLDGDLTVNFNLPTGSATNGTDYQTLPTSVLIPDGQASATVKLTVKDDGAVEGSETATLGLATGDDYVVGSPASATVTIADDDSAPPPPGFSAKINFQPAAAAVPPGYLVDAGLAYASRGNGLTYGWKVDNSDQARERNNKLSPDQLHDTLIQMGATKTTTWEIAVPNGTYQVHLIAGDSNYIDSVYKINVENVLLINATPTAAAHWVDMTGNVTVSDGKLTITNASGAVNNKVDFIEITSVGAVAPLPQVSITSPDTSAAEQGSDPGTFTITRSGGDTTKSLVVNFTVGGTATNGTDYNSLPSSVTFAAGQTSMNLTVKPIDDKIVDANETVTLKLATSAVYTAGASTTATVTILDNDKAPTLFAAKVNFQPAGSPVPAGYVVDSGLVYTSRGNGLTYGWKVDNSTQTRDRNSTLSADQQHDTLIQMGAATNVAWEIAVPNGTYQVHLVSGDAGFTDSFYKINVENVLLMNAAPTHAAHWVDVTGTVTVADGKLTISNASGAMNNKIDFVEIQQLT